MSISNRWPSHSRTILSGNEHAIVVQEDARRPDAILANPDVLSIIDFDQPVAVLMIALLHYIPEDPERIVARMREAMSPGSYLAIAHITDDSRPEQWNHLVELSKRNASVVTPRSRAAIEALFDGFDLVEPGVVWAPEWRPEEPEVVEHPESSSNLVGIGRRG